MKIKEKLIVVGWGRMGITHTSIINGLYPDAFDITIVEPNNKVARITKKTLGYKVVSSLTDLDIKNSVVIIATPPFSHRELSETAIKMGAKSIFVEKPFGLYDQRVVNDSRISAGYVLRFSEVVQTLREIISSDGCKRIKLDYSSNTLTKPPKGWRNSVYGGVLNEMGSHLIDLILYLGGNKPFDILESSIESVISNVDDIVNVKGKLGDIIIELSLNWVNPSFRKPIWSGSIETNKGLLINFDQQSIDTGFKASQVDYYVRGREFSLQMKHLIEKNSEISCTPKEANRVHDIISLIKQKA